MNLEKAFSHRAHRDHREETGTYDYKLVPSNSTAERAAPGTLSAQSRQRRKTRDTSRIFTVIEV